jgi:hypothetical protein
MHQSVEENGVERTRARWKFVTLRASVTFALRKHPMLRSLCAS